MALNTPAGNTVVVRDIIDTVLGKPIKEMTVTDFYSALDAMKITDFRAYQGKLSPEQMERIVANLRAQIGVEVRQLKKR